MDINREKIDELTEIIAKKEIEASLVAVNSALAPFTDEEKECVKDLIEKCKADPASVEINTIVDKIKANKFDKLMAKQVTFEQNSFAANKNTMDDIFGVMEEPSGDDKDGSLF